jgi:hypothetical protein
MSLGNKPVSTLAYTSSIGNNDLFYLSYYDSIGGTYTSKNTKATDLATYINSVSANTLNQVLTAGNTSNTAIKAANGGGRLDLRYGGSDNEVMLSNDNAGYGKSLLYLTDSYIELSAYDAGSVLLNYADTIAYVSGGVTPLPGDPKYALLSNSAVTYVQAGTSGNVMHKLINSTNTQEFYTNSAIRGKVNSSGLWFFGDTFPGAAVNATIGSIGSTSDNTSFSFAAYDSSFNAYFKLRSDNRVIYTDGNQGAGKFLQSDASGVATWSSVLSNSVTMSADPTTALGICTKQYAESLVVGLWDDRGNYDASGNAFPSSGGSGTAGAILKGDVWTISVAGTLGGVEVAAGDTVRALVDTPGTTASNWAIAETNLGYTPITNVLNSGYILVGNGSNVAAAVSPTLSASGGAFALSNAGVFTFPNADTGTRGLLLAADWNTFNNKVDSSYAGFSDRRDVLYYRKTGTTTYQGWYNQGITKTTLTTRTNVVKDFIHAIPFIVPVSVTVDRIGIEVTGAGTAASVIRLGIYSDNGNKPGSLLLDAGTVTADSAAVKTITISQALTPGLYWLSYIHNSVSNLTLRTVPASATPNITGQASTLTDTYRNMLAVSQAYGALPGTFPAFTDSDFFTGDEAAIWLRFS